MEVKKTKNPFFAPKEPFRTKKISSFNIIIILNIFFLKNKISKNNKYYKKKFKKIKMNFYQIFNIKLIKDHLERIQVHKYI